MTDDRRTRQHPVRIAGGVSVSRTLPMWEDRFATPDYVFGTEPAAFLRDHAGLLRPGQTLLSVAEGEGRNAVFCAGLGLQVTGLEYAPSAIAKAHRLAAERGVVIEMRQADVLDPGVAWPGPFDVVLGVFIQFAGPDQRAGLFAQMAAALRPGGLLMLHGYTPDQVGRGTGGPPSRDNMYTPALLTAAFAGWPVEVCRTYEHTLTEGRGHVGPSALIDFIAVKPG